MGSLVKRGALISMIRLPKVPICSSVRTETGTWTTSGSAGSSSCSSSQLRTAPAQIETTTSLTVQRCLFFTSFTSSRSSCPKAKRRWGEIRPLKQVFGAL